MSKRLFIASVWLTEAEAQRALIDEYPQAPKRQVRVYEVGNGVWGVESNDGDGFLTDHGDWHLIWRSEGTFYGREAAEIAAASVA
jgi:hypothetical protein